MKSQIDNLNALSDALEKNDKAKFDEAVKKMEEANKKLEALKLSEEDKKKLGEKYKGDFEKASKRLTEAFAKTTLKDVDPMKLMKAMPGAPS
jgi:hypothetical protein